MTLGRTDTPPAWQAFIQFTLGDFCCTGFALRHNGSSMAASRAAAAVVFICMHLL